MKFHVPTLIGRKRDGGTLTPEEIRALVDGYTEGSIPDYQMAAFAMAVLFQGMDAAETAALTRAMLESGDVFHHPAGHPPIVDKHSTGGIGDKVSLILAPLVACTGVRVPMVSGRGLGITGGTLDKLESIPGFRVGITIPEAQDLLERIGVVMMGQTDRFCPADKKLYALRDVTGTVPSIPLITASIMSKKLAESLDRLVLDLSAKISPVPRKELEHLLDDGSARRKFDEIVAAHGGNPADLPKLGQIHRAPFIRDFPAPCSGTVVQVDAGLVGQAALQLGAGRARASDDIDPAVGFDHLVKCGEPVHQGRPLCRVHARNAVDFEIAEALLEKAIRIEP